MNRQIKPPAEEETWESDPVWELLNQAPAPPASARFSDETVRQARLVPAPRSWWRTLLAPAPLAGIATAATAIAILIVGLADHQEKSASHVAASASLEEIAETEMLLAAVDHLDDFSDAELVSLIGF